MSTVAVNVSIATGQPLVTGGTPNPAGVATDAATADTDVGTVVTDFATANTAVDAFAAAVIAITGDTYNVTTNQFTFGGATGLTHAQWATVGALLNTAFADYLVAKADADIAKTATAAVKAETISAGGDDLTISVNSSNFTTKGQIIAAARDAIDVLAQSLGVR
jgi:hypothetical protein